MSLPFESVGADFTYILFLYRIFLYATLPRVEETLTAFDANFEKPNPEQHKHKEK